MAGMLAKLDAAGVQSGDGPPDDDFYLWTECEPAWRAFLQLQTQWRVGMGGATGLDYAAVIAHLNLQHGRRAVRDLYAGVRACEMAVLEVWSKQREAERAAREG